MHVTILCTESCSAPQMQLCTDAICGHNEDSTLLNCGCRASSRACNGRRRPFGADADRLSSSISASACAGLLNSVLSLNGNGNIMASVAKAVQQLEGTNGHYTAVLFGRLHGDSYGPNWHCVSEAQLVDESCHPGIRPVDDPWRVTASLPYGLMVSDALHQLKAWSSQCERRVANLSMESLDCPAWQ